MTVPQRRRRIDPDTGRYRRLSRVQKEINTAPARQRGPGERANAQLKSWKILRKGYGLSGDRHIERIRDQPRAIPSEPDGAGSGRRIMRNELNSPMRAARSGMSSATCKAMGRESVLMRMISSWISGG